jgi:hypothetical protein
LRYIEIVRSLPAAALALAALSASGGGWAATQAGQQSPPRSIVLRDPGYTTAYWVQSSLVRNGVRQGNRLRTVKTARCVGVGSRRWKERLGWLYHEFTCAVSTRWDPLAHAKVFWWSDNTYRYDFIGCKPRRGCR